MCQAAAHQRQASELSSKVSFCKRSICIMPAGQIQGLDRMFASALQVCRSLIELGVNFELEKFLADGCHTVDIVLRIPGKPR